MNLFSAQGQSSLTNDELSKLVRVCEKCEADKVDLKFIVADQKLILEAQAVRLIEKEELIQTLTSAVANIKIAYYDDLSKMQRGKFWVWIKGVGVGVVIGAAGVIIFLI